MQCNTSTKVFVTAQMDSLPYQMIQSEAAYLYIRIILVISVRIALYPGIIYVQTRIKYLIYTAIFSSLT